MKYFKEKGFTLIELMIVIAIIGILATAILINISQSKKNSRINGTKTTLKGLITIVVSCNTTNGVIINSDPVNIGSPVCSNIPDANWPMLPSGYAYIPGGNYSYDCSFQVSTNGDSGSNLVCDCMSQKCN